MKKKSIATAWFKLSNYERVKNFGYDDWSREIAQRIVFGKFITPSDNVDGKYGRPNVRTYEEIALKFWEHVRSHGTSKKFVYAELIPKPAKGASVTGVTRADVVSGVLSWPWMQESVTDFREVVNKAKSMNWRAPEFMTIFDDFEAKYSMPHNIGPCLTAAVDLSASDEQLLSDFKEWIASQRAAKKISSRKYRLTQTDFDDWASNKLLQYFDLVMISKLDGVHISNQIIGDLLFPDDVEIAVSERIRKVTRVKAQKVFSDEMQMLIEAQRSL